MKLFPFLIGVVLLTFPGTLQAQGRWIKYLSKDLSVNTRLLSPLDRGLKRAYAGAAAREDIRLSVARLDHALLLDYPMDKRPHSTAFLFQTDYKGLREVWALTAGHVVQTEEKVLLSFYNGKKEILVEGVVVQQSPALLSDAALIKLNSIPADLQPLKLASHINPQEKLTTWGYASNKLYQIGELSFEKDNTRFIRTDFPDTQTKRSGLCGGPLLNNEGKALGVHCGSSLDDKSYAANISIVPYLLKAYYEGNADVPIFMGKYQLGTIRMDERIWYIQCMDENGNLINSEAVYDQLHQSDVLNLLKDPEVRYMRFLLGQRYEDKITRILVYDKITQTYRFEQSAKNGYNFYE